MVTRRNDSFATGTLIPYGRESLPHADLPLADQELLDMYYYLLLARGLDDRMWLLNRQGKANFVISCNGHEASQVGSAWALRPGVDWVYPYYRDLGVILPLGMTPREVMLAVFARADDPSSGGRQMAGHWGKRDLKILSVSSPVGTQIPQAAGTAYASKLFGRDEVTAVYFGEGTTSQGDFHEGLNFVSIHRLPVVFICENNGYAISTPQRLEMAVGSVAARAPAYGMPGVSVDGNDVLAVFRAMTAAVERARRGDGPTLIETRTYRLVPHSSDDNDRLYRTKEEVDTWKKRDPVDRFQRYLQEQGLLTPDVDAGLRARVKAEVNDATDYAERAPLPQVEDIAKNLYAA